MLNTSQGMENLNNVLFNHHLKSSDKCCEILLKIRQYTSIVQIELSRLGNLQAVSNQLLDNFYSLKQEFDFLSKEALEIKYFGEDVLKCTAHIDEVSTFLKSVWQMGKLRFSEQSKRSQYTCFIGVAMIEVVSIVHSFVDEIMSQIYYQPYHSECATAICSHSAQIYTILQGESLSSADICFRQYIYLTAANPFLQQLNHLIHQYLIRTDVHTVKQFIETIVLDTPSVLIDTSGVDSAAMAPFRCVVDLLNGKLLYDDFLDHRSDIKPVVEDDINLKKSLQANDTLRWIRKQYSLSDVNQLWLQSGVQMFADFTQRNNELFAEFFSFQSSMLTSHKKSVGFVGSSRMMDSRNASSAFGSPMISQRKYSRRGRKKGQTNNQNTSQDDLQPIKLHALQSPILKPLF